MRTEVAEVIVEGIVESVIRDGNLYARNAAMQHGLPMPDDVVIKTPQTVAPKKLLVAVKNVSIGAPDPVASDPVSTLSVFSMQRLPSWAKGMIIAAAVLGVSAIGYGLRSTDSVSPTPTITNPTEPLLEWLRDQGHNLPPSGVRNDR